MSWLLKLKFIIWYWHFIAFFHFPINDCTFIVGIHFCWHTYYLSFTLSICKEGNYNYSYKMHVFIVIGIFSYVIGIFSSYSSFIVIGIFSSHSFCIHRKGIEETIHLFSKWWRTKGLAGPLFTSLFYGKTTASSLFGGGYYITVVTIVLLCERVV